MAGLHPRPIISGSLGGGSSFSSFPGGSYLQPGLRTTGLKQGPEWDNKQTHLQLFSNFIVGKSHPESLLKLWILPNPPHTTSQKIRFSWSEWVLGIYNHNKLPCNPEAGETLGKDDWWGHWRRELEMQCWESLSFPWSRVRALKLSPERGNIFFLEWSLVWDNRK